MSTNSVLAEATGTIAILEKGEKGAVERPRNWSEIPSGSSMQSGASGESYIDIVLYADNWYQCIKSYTYSSDILPTNTIYYKNITDYKRLATGLFLASKAYINNLGVDNILITSEGGGSGDVYLRADKNGIVCNQGTFNNVLIKGTVRSPFNAVGVGFDNTFTDNLSLVTNDGVLNVNMAKTDVDQVGRLVHFTNYRWGDTYQNGSATLSMPSGYYFFEDGKAKTGIKVSRECVTLLGLGDTDNFYGWLVLGRSDIDTSQSYGHGKKILAIGKVTGTSSGATISCQTFDGSTLKVTRNNTGVYTVTIPSAWNLSNPFIMLTGVGFVYEGTSSTTNPAKATLISATSTGFTVHVSDDATKNDGSFNFEISNFSDFKWIS